MKVLITGAGGQVGRELARLSWVGHDITSLDRAALDVTDAAAVDRTITQLAPDVIVNAAAYTAVDRAESEPAVAKAVNDTAVDSLVAAAERIGARLLHLSTDYVFDGSLGRPYVEGDNPHPLGVYGTTKLAGEHHVLASPVGHVFRTSWVYGALGPNFVATMLRLATERDEIGVVDDQHGCPTGATDIASALAACVDTIADGNDPPTRLTHLAAPDSASWFDVAEATFDASTPGFAGTLRRLTTAEYPTAAPRPADTRLNTDRLVADWNITMPSWRVTLANVVAELERT